MLKLTVVELIALIAQSFDDSFI